MGIYDIMSIQAATNGDIQTMQYLIITNKTAIDYLKIGKIASKNGKIEIIKLMDKYFPLNGLQYISKAVKYNHIDIVKYIVEKTNFVNIYNKVGIYASKYNNFLVMKWVVDNGADDFNMFASVSAKYGYIELLKWLLLKGANKMNMIALFAAEGGNVDIVKFLLESGATNKYDIYLVAKTHNHEELCKYLRNDAGIKDENSTSIFSKLLNPFKKILMFQ